MFRAFANLLDKRPGGLKSRTLLVRLAMASALLVLLVGPSAGARATVAAQTVNSTGDEPDANPGNGRCLTAVATCTLRAAIQEANAGPGLDEIFFNIPGPAPGTISPASPLPAITGPVLLDATTQPGFTGSPILELKGTNAGLAANGLEITAGGSTVKGLVINRFTGAGIALHGDANLIQGNFIGTSVSGTTALGNGVGVRITDASNNVIGGTVARARNLISGNRESGVLIGVSAFGLASTGNRVEGNFIGTDVTGTRALGNLGDGVLIGDTSNNIVGGTAARSRNLISGNGVAGVSITGGALATGNRVEGNLIGTDVRGTRAVGNAFAGVDISDAPNNTVGGTAAGARNVISGNTRYGVFIAGNFTGNRVEGNFIGTDPTGTAALPNGCSGVFLLDARKSIIGGTDPRAANVISGHLFCDGIRINGGTGNQVQGNVISRNAVGVGIGVDGSGNTVGGALPGAGNVITLNVGAGVAVSSGTGNAVRSNAIFSNGGLGIDLNPLGVTPNDPRDADTGANNLQNFPILTSVSSSGASTVIRGRLNSAPSTRFTLEFFASGTCDASRRGEGERFLGVARRMTGGTGLVRFVVTLPVGVPAGQVVTATATDRAGNTSEFSRCAAVSAAP